MLFEWLRVRHLSSFPKTAEEIVLNLNYADASPVTAFIPRGRSAQADKANEKKPRIIITSHTPNKVTGRAPLGFEDLAGFPSSDYEGKLYFGHSENAEQIESLSWNKDSHRFDFFIISNFAVNKQPQVVEITQRKNCTKCHQNEAPIWTLPPWTEVMVHDPAKKHDISRSQKATPGKALYRDRGVLISDELTPVENNTGLALDSSSGAGNRLAQITTLIKSLCRQDLDCRRMIVEAAVTNLNYSNYIHKNFVIDNSAFGVDFVQGPFQNLKLSKKLIPKSFLRYEDRILNLWPVDQFSYVSQLLTDPSFGIAGDTQINTLDPIASRGALQAIDDQLAVAMIWDTAFEIMGLTLEDARNLLKISPRERIAKIQRLGDGNYNNETKALLENWLPTRTALLDFYGIKTDSTLLNADTDKTPSQLFNQYCQSCHASTQKENPVIAFSDADSLEKFSTAIKRRMTKGSMPPQDSLQPTLEQKLKMLKSLEKTSEITTQPASDGLLNVKISHLGMRYQEATNVNHSYIVRSNDPVVEEGYIRCHHDIAFSSAKHLEKIKDSSVPLDGIIVAKTASGRILVALENFPNYALGQIIQVLGEFNGEINCQVFALGIGGSIGKLQMKKHERPAVSSVSLNTQNLIPSTVKIAGMIKHTNHQNLSIDLVSSDNNIFSTVFTNGSISLSFNSYIVWLNKLPVHYDTTVAASKPIVNELKESTQGDYSPNLRDSDSRLLIPAFPKVLREIYKPLSDVDAAARSKAELIQSKTVVAAENFKAYGLSCSANASIKNNRQTDCPNKNIGDACRVGHEGEGLCIASSDKSPTFCLCLAYSEIKKNKNFYF